MYPNHKDSLPSHRAVDEHPVLPHTSIVLHMLCNGSCLEAFTVWWSMLTPGQTVTIQTFKISGKEPCGGSMDPPCPAWEDKLLVWRAWCCRAHPSMKELIEPSTSLNMFVNPKSFEISMRYTWE